MDLLYLFKVLYKRLWIIITIPMIAGVAAFLFTRDMEKQFKSTAQLSTGFTTNNRVQIIKENFDYWESKSNFENLVEMMKSELIGSMVSYNLLLHDLKGTPFRTKGPALSISEGEIIRNTLTSKLASFELLTSYDDFENRIIKLLDERGYEISKWIKDNDLIIERIRDTDFIKVEFLSENPFLSSYIVNKFCDEYIRYNNALKTTVTEESLEFFASQVELKKKELDEKTQELNNFKSDNQVYNYEKESAARLNQLAEYESKLLDAEGELKGLSVSLKTIRSRIDTYDKIKNNNSKLLELKAKINELNRIYINDGSRDKELASTITELNQQLQVELERYGAQSDISSYRPKTLRELTDEKQQLELDYEKATITVASIQSKVNSLKGSVSRIGSKESTIASLERERDNAFKDYTSANEKYNEAKSKSLIVGNGVKIMIKGQPNAEPESSKTLVILALAVIASAAMCIGTIVMVEYFDYRIKTPDKFENFSKTYLIGHVNQIDTKKLDVANLFNQKHTRRELETTKHALRKIRFVIDNSGKRIFLVSSTKIGQGKTFIIVSLAYSLSMLNKRILIIDTNFKHNSLTKLLVAKPMLSKANEFKLLNEGTISHPQSNDDDYSRGFISQTNNKNIDIICSSEGLESPSEIFAGRDFQKMVNTLKHRYDYIFMEGPALNEFSDTKELVRYVDGVIAVFSAQSTLKLLDKESIKYLKTLNGKFLGAILNNLNKEDIKV